MVKNINLVTKLCVGIALVLTAIAVIIGITINNNSSLKIKLFQSIYVNYQNVFKQRLASRFNHNELLKAIEYAKKQPFVMEQINADLTPYKHGISAARIEELFMGLQRGHKHHDLVKYKIADGKVIVDPRSDTSYAAAQQTILEILQLLTKKRLIPDCEFIVVLSDYLIYVPQGVQGPIPVMTFAKDLQRPLEKDTILIPDWVNVRFGEELRGRIKFASKVFPWQSKRDIIHWRGGIADSMGHRSKLVALGGKYDFIDAGITDGLHVVHVDPEFSIQNKYQISLDGARCTWQRITWQMHSNTLMIKPNSPQIQWFYRGLQPYINYLPINDVDSVSIRSAYEWLQANDDKALEISRNANEFAKNNFKTQDLIAYYALLLQEYAKLFVVE